jgi:hypothetical protein
VIKDYNNLLLDMEKENNIRPEGSLRPIPFSGINKGFLYGWVVTLALGALSFGYSIGSFAQDIQTFSCLYYSEQGLNGA